jgi:NAD(P)H-hydrate epimerase
MARFVTASGIEVPAVSAAQMREVDRITVLETGPSLLQMMENAGRTLALDVLESLGEPWQGA